MIDEGITVDESRIEGRREAVCVDGLEFVMAASSTSAVDESGPTRFRYFERDGVIWGDYVGDTVRTGRFAGIREGDTLRLSYNHRGRAGALVHGNAVSVISRSDDGALRLTEFYAGPEGPQLSVCIQDRDAG